MRALITPVLSLLVLAPLGAQTIDINSTAGIFHDHTGGSNVTYSASGNRISWGATPTNGSQSFYQFAGAQPPASVNLAAGNPFLLGTFTHGNFPIRSGTGITGVWLDIMLSMTVPTGGDVINKTFTYEFDHWETPNNANPCANGGANGSGVNRNGCADSVVIVNPTASQTFTVGDYIYSLDMGFSTDGGRTILDEFWTKEKKSNSAQLFGVFTAQVIPEPGFYGLLGLGLAGLYTVVSRRRKRA